MKAQVDDVEAEIKRMKKSEMIYVYQILVLYFLLVGKICNVLFVSFGINGMYEFMMHIKFLMRCHNDFCVCFVHVFESYKFYI